MRVFKVLCVIGLGVVVGGPARLLVVGAAGQAPNINVTVTLRDDSGTDRIQSDTGAPYQNNVDGVVAYIAGQTGALTFGTHANGRTVRTMKFFLTDCVAAPCSPPAAWADPLDEPSGMLANALLSNGQVLTGGLLGMTQGVQLEAWIKMDIPIDSDPAYYNVCFDSRKVVGPCGMPPAASSTNARIRRDTPSSWTVWADAADRADLIRDNQSKRSREFSLLGTYSMPFSMTVQCLNVKTNGECS